MHGFGSFTNRTSEHSSKTSERGKLKWVYVATREERANIFVSVGLSEEVQKCGYGDKQIGIMDLSLPEKEVFQIMVSCDKL